MKRFLTHLFRICLQSCLPEDEFVLLSEKDFMSFKLDEKAFGDARLADMFPSMTQGVLNVIHNWQVATVIAQEVIRKGRDGTDNKLYS